MQVTRRDVAQLAGVSDAVVSYVLNGGPRGVSSDKAERVRRAVEKLQYRPNSVARALRLQRSNALGLIIPDAANPFFAELSRAVEEAAYERGYILLVGNSLDSTERERDYVRVFRERQVEGILFVSAAGRFGAVAQDAGGTALIALDRVGSGNSMSSVAVDNRAAAQAVVEHLIGHGHQRIGCVGGPAELPTSRDRSAGWRAALHSAGLPASPRLRATAPFSRRGGYIATRQLLADRPTALFAASEQQAIGSLHALWEAGLRAPDDIALGAFDGTEVAEFTGPPLTVARQPVAEIARRAIDLATASAPARARHEVVAFELVVRRSCGCTPRKKAGT